MGQFYLPGPTVLKRQFALVSCLSNKKNNKNSLYWILVWQLFHATISFWLCSCYSLRSCVEEVRRRERGGENHTPENTNGARENEWRVTHRWIIVATVNAMKQPWPWKVSQTHAQNTIHSWYLLFSFCPMMFLCKKTKQQQKQQQKKVKGRLESNQNTHSFCFFVTFLFGILQHLFIFRFLGIKVEQPLPSCTVYATIICLAVNKSFCTLS